jgi:hypothetical protein
MEIKADMKYIIYTIIAMDENLSELKGKFIHATESLIVRGEDKYRMVHKDDTNRLNHKYFLLDKISGDNEVLKVGTVVLIPDEYLEAMEIPNGM